MMLSLWAPTCTYHCDEIFAVNLSKKVFAIVVDLFGG